MRIWYDTEFIEDGRTIELISIGMVREDDAELYFVSDSAGVMRRAVEHDWLRENVVPGLPVTFRRRPLAWNWDQKHPDYPRVASARIIAAAVRGFILSVPDPQLWAWYAAYDHVALCQLWGRMTDLPEGVPMWTNDLKQEAVRLGNPRVPQQADGQHNALADARHNRVIADFLAARA